MQHLLRTDRVVSANKILEVIATADIVASWKSDFGIDVARLFEGIEDLLLLENEQTGQLSFYPPIEGDAAFYQDLRKFDWYHPPTKEEFIAAAKWLEAGDKVTDIGAGVAGFAAHVSPEAYFGLETDDAATAQAQAKGIAVQNMDMAAYRASSAFRPAELVTAFQVLEHVPLPDAFLADMVSLMATDGYIAVGVPDADSYVADLPDFMLNAPPHHLTWWTERTLETAMRRAGLSIKAVYRFEVEPWERQLWWMAQIAKRARPARLGLFGRELRARKVASFLSSWVLQKLPIPKTARGSTLLMIGEKMGI